MSNQHSNDNEEPQLGQTFRDDFRRIKFKEDITSEYKELKEYFLTENRREQLVGMNKIKKFFLIPWWLLKSLYFKLTPIRRFLLVIGLIFMFLSFRTNVESDSLSINFFGLSVFSGLIFLFVLALELKDKMYAKTELEEGRAIQRALMPDPKPIVPGWDIWLYTEPANDVGGDLLDFMKISESKFGISVGDIAGKGLSAALLMAKLQSTVRAIAPDYDSLDKLGTKLNNIFHRDSLPRLFASFLYLELSASSGNIKILNAGHLPPIIIKDDGITRLPKISPALGIMNNAEFKEQSLQLSAGEYIIIYSDGLTEARNQMREFYGDKRLLKNLHEFSYHSSEDLGKKVLNSIEYFRGKAKAYDDLTIAVIKRL